MKIADLISRKIAIIGLAREGQAALKLLKDLDIAEIGLFDLKSADEWDLNLKNLIEEIENKGIKVNKFSGENYLESLVDFQIAIKSPGVNPRIKLINQAKENGLKLTSTTELFLNERQGKVIAISGSKGKTTTSTLIYLILKEAGFDTELVGNIGNPILNYLETDQQNKVYVMEVSSYQLESLKDKYFDMAVLVSFFPDHLDYHEGLDNYFKAKMQLVHSLKDDGILLYNGQNKQISTYIEKELIAEKSVNFLNSERAESIAKSWHENSFLRFYDLDLKPLLKGKHNWENIAAALETTRIFAKMNDKKIADEVVKNVIENFVGVEHRLEIVGIFKGVMFVNDAISTTPESTIAALNSFKQKIGTIIVGGLDRGYEFKELAKELINKNIENIIFFPETGAKIEQAILDLNNNEVMLPNFFYTDKMKDAVKIAYEKTRQNEICLLSNASPSHNLFKNFEDKGNQFKQFVTELAEK